MVTYSVDFQSYCFFFYTILTLIASFAHKDVVQILLKNKADVKEKNNNGYIALHLGILFIL